MSTTTCGNCGAVNPSQANACTICNLPLEERPAGRASAPRTAGVPGWRLLLPLLGLAVAGGVAWFVARPSPDTSGTAGTAGTQTELAAATESEPILPTSATAEPVESFGSGIVGVEAPSHKTTSPRVRMGATTVSGRLPKEVIQRIVRQNFGRFRLCYETGLEANPNLQGRVQVRFVIDRNGAVSNVSDSGSTLPDPEVVKCVVSAYRRLSFPKPEGGIVTVVYPIIFEPG